MRVMVEFIKTMFVNGTGILVNGALGKTAQGTGRSGRRSVVADSEQQLGWECVGDLVRGRAPPAHAVQLGQRVREAHTLEVRPVAHGCRIRCASSSMRTTAFG